MRIRLIKSMRRPLGSVALPATNSKVNAHDRKQIDELMWIEPTDLRQVENDK